VFYERKIIIISTRATYYLLSKMKHLKTLNKYLWRYKWHLGLGLVFIIVSDLYGVWAQVYIREGIDAIADLDSQMKGTATDEVVKSNFYSTIFSLLWLYLGFNLIKGFFLFCQRQTIIVMSRRIEYDLKNAIYKQYQELPVTFYQKGNTGDIMNRISEDVGKVRMYLGPGIMYTINLVVLLAITIGQMLQVNAELTLYVLAPLPIMTVLVFKISTRINKKSSILQEKQSDLSTRVQEDFTAIRLIKTFGRKLFARKKFDSKTDEYKIAATSLLKTDAYFTPVMTLLVGLSTVLTICIGGIQCIRGNISIGNIAEFVLYVNMLTWPFASVGWISSLIQRAAASQERINEFMDEKTYSEKLQKGNTIENEFESIKFDNVNFNYTGSNRSALTNISFEVKKGKTLGIIGKTGSGKTTIANILNAEQSTYSGEVFIGKHELKSLALHNLRNTISCVPQDAFLFSNTIHGNIAFGTRSGEATAEQVQAYAKKAVVHENIMAFEKKYDTIVGERGITLSGGQKQRITIARSMIREPEILLFDDCLSAVDAETEKEILTNLVDFMKNKTTFLISHRVSTVMHADEIIVLDEGKIIEKGTHQQLINGTGLYKLLYNKQSGV
jgi:ATP-binding cassette subfamily B multidrug efflux pump